MMGRSIMTSWQRPTRAAIVGLGLIFVALPVLAQQSPPPARVSTAEVTRQVLSPEIQVPGTVISKNDSRISRWQQNQRKQSRHAHAAPRPKVKAASRRCKRRCACA